MPHPADDLRELQALQLRKAKLKQLLKRLTWQPGPLTQEEVAVIHDCSRHEIRQIERRAILKARRAATSLLTPPQTPNLHET